MTAGTDLLDRYRRIWRESWQKRKTMDAPPRLKHEVLFLPSALALQDAPVHPAPRIIQGVIIAFAALTLLWACTGEIDIVATATGKIVPSGRSKIIQASEVAVVRNILVRDGQGVKAGELLIELDASLAVADVLRLTSDFRATQVDIARSRALLEAIELGRPPANLQTLIPDANTEQQMAAQQWLEGQYTELQSALNQSAAAIEQRDAEIATVQATVASLEQSIPIMRELAADYRRLLEKEIVPKHAYLEKEQARLDQERELSTQKLRVQELLAARKAAQSQHSSVTATTRSAMLSLQHASEQRAAALLQELSKAQKRESLMRLTAPVDGIVQELAIHTIGGVVTEAQALLVIVPSGELVEVEALFENKDIGFVRPGQQVEIKVDTFTFTKYGVVNGVVQSISKDAIEHDQLGLVYSTRIQLMDKTVAVGGSFVDLSPGMAVKAEVKTDKRKVIDYFLSPLKRYANESLNER